MAVNLLLLLGAAFVVSGTFFLVQWGRRNIVLKQLCNNQGEYLGLRTHSPHLSRSKKALQTTKVGYSGSFPPSRRFVPAEGSVIQDLNKMDKWEEKLLPLEMSCLDADDSLLTPCGYSVKEIKALGNFPDYATLSGVPLPKPYPEFDIKRALPRPYRPFRWAYHQTMSLTKMEPGWWLELECTYKERIEQRLELFAEHGEAVLQALPGSELACKELMEMVLQFLCCRYPTYFRLSTDTRYFYNDILRTTTNLTETPPLHVLLHNVPEDFAIMSRDEKTGLYIFRAGVICSAIGWNVSSKINLPLSEIHGPIPDYKEKMKFSMDRYFATLPTDKPIQRGSWSFEMGKPLYMPPNDPHFAQRTVQPPNLPLSRIHLRVDWQTLRRLPLSGSVVFNFKALFTPVDEFRDEPGIPGLVLRVLNEGKESLMEYKGTWHIEHVVKPALGRWHEEQVEKGVVSGEWEPRTLAESPFFEGWEGKWRGKQGF